MSQEPPPPVNPSLLEIARAYVSAGLCVLPIRGDGSKKPSLPTWKEFQRRRPTPRELATWFHPGSPVGIAVVCGAVSGGLEVLDFDDGDVFLEWAALVGAEAPGLLPRLTQVRTPAGGRHVYYRCPGLVKGNRKLARTAAGKALIETRGEGGYVLAPGCPPCCHPTGGVYEHVAGPALTAVPLLEKALS